LKKEYKKLKVENHRDKEKGKTQNIKYTKKETVPKKEKNIGGFTHKKNGLWDLVSEVKGTSKKTEKELTGVREEIKLLRDGIEKIQKSLNIEKIQKKTK
jgi:hypothetical protein